MFFHIHISCKDFFHLLSVFCSSVNYIGLISLFFLVWPQDSYSLIYKVVLVSGGQQNDSVIDTYVTIFFQILFHYQFSSVQSLSRVRLFATPWTAARQASLSITNSRSLPKLTSIESVMPSNLLIPCCPLLFLPSIFPSIRVFSSELALHIRWPKYWSFSIRPSNEYSRLISFRIDWFDLLAVQGTLKCLLQQHRSKASIL